MSPWPPPSGRRDPRHPSPVRASDLFIGPSEGFQGLEEFKKGLEDGDPVNVCQYMLMIFIVHLWTG